ncbi:MAG TPA: preprotein translocase subunit SecG [Candidatus Paceibacterota bacterium]|nr:preprotein translocase subunit SecG [Candidatus Paceibacterota bacterium]
MTTTILTAIQIGAAVLLIVTILLQQKGEGLSGGLVGSALEYSTKRGVEKWVFWATIVLAILFFGASIARLIL